MLVPPPRALPITSVRAEAGEPAAIHSDTNAQVHSEVEWNVGR